MDDASKRITSVSSISRSEESSVLIRPILSPASNKKIRLICIYRTLLSAVTGETLFHPSLPNADQRQAQTRIDHYGDGLLGHKVESSPWFSKHVQEHMRVLIDLYLYIHRYHKHSACTYTMHRSSVCRVSNTGLATE